MGKGRGGGGLNPRPLHIQDTLRRGDLRFVGFLLGTSDLGTAVSFRANWRLRVVIDALEAEFSAEARSAQLGRDNLVDGSATIASSMKAVGRWCRWPASFGSYHPTASSSDARARRGCAGRLRPAPYLYCVRDG
jgi:hypothetical protein